MRNRYLWIAMSAIAIVAVGLFWSHSERRVSAQSIELDRSLIALFPPNATTLVGADIERLKSTALYRHIEEQSRKDNGRSELDEFAATTGFDPRRDVQDLLLAAWTDASSAKDSQFVAVARGRFEVSNLSRELRQKKAQVETYRGFEIFSPSPERARPESSAARRRDSGAFTFLNDRTVLAGTRPALLAAIDRKLSGGPSLAANTDLLARAQKIRASNQVWAVSLKPGELVSRSLPKEGPAETSNFARIFSSMQNSSFALDLMNGLSLQAEGLCQTPQDAKTLADAARGAVALGRLTANQKEPEIMTLLDSIQVEERGAELGISVRIDQLTLEKLMEKSRTRRRVETVNLR